MNTPAVVFDIDGTLADCAHRRHFVEGAVKDWDSFLNEALVVQDPLIEPVLRLLQQLRRAGNAIILCSGRNESLRHATFYWLSKHKITGYYDHLFMRPLGDKRPDTEVKAEMLQAIRDSGFDPWCAVDDRDSVVDMWREQGLLCLQVARGAF